MLAEAVQELFPGTQVTIGPAIEDGFYYDFARDEPFQPGRPRPDREAHARDRRPRREDHAARSGTATRPSPTSSRSARPTRPRSSATCRRARRSRVYRQGQWKDLCLGPHLPSTKQVGKAFKLTKLAGAYWRGDHRNAQLQRIYGTAWATEADLDAYLDAHRGGREARPPQASAGPWTSSTCRKRARAWSSGTPRAGCCGGRWRPTCAAGSTLAGYVEVKTPQVLDTLFWEKPRATGRSIGHTMFVCETVEGEVLSLKPMNCPGHVQIFNVGQKSYRDLPLRMAEFGACHRYEPSGALHGLMRVRGFTQDDAHIFCREDQIVEETDALRRA